MEGFFFITPFSVRTASLDTGLLAFPGAFRSRSSGQAGAVLPVLTAWVCGELCYGLCFRLGRVGASLCRTSARFGGYR